MIKVATVFSGIGAAEQALKQLGIEHEIVFACDNGERYFDYTKEEIDIIIKNNPHRNTEDIIQELYEQTKKPNNVKKSYFANYEIDESRWFEDFCPKNSKKPQKMWFFWYATNVVKRTKTVAVKDVLCKYIMLNGKFYIKTYYIFNIVLFCSF